MQMWSWKPARGAVTPVDTIPASPTAGQAILHTPTGLTLLWNGSAWTSMVPGVTIHANPGGITAPKAVTLVGAALAITNPDCSVHALPRLEGQALIDAVAAADVVLDCSDNYATRHTINAACVRHRVPLVAGAAVRFDGQITVVDPRQPEIGRAHV